MKNPWLFAKDFLLDNKGKGFFIPHTLHSE